MSAVSGEATVTSFEREAPPHVSAVICTRDRPDKIGNAVRSVLRNSYPDFGLTVIDQSTTAATATAMGDLRAQDSRLRYVHVNEQGLSRAYNRAISETDGEILAFTDDDCLVPPDWISLIVRAFESDHEGDLLYGQVLPVARAEDESGMTPLLVIERSERLSKRDGFRVFGMGANFAARRRLFTCAGVFDETLGGGGPLRSSQDFDLAYRAYRAGSVILLRPEVTLLHDGRRDAADWPALLRNYGVGDGAFYSKHVRCGDLFAFRLLLQRIARTGSRALKQNARGNRAAEWGYLSGVFAGIREGMKFEVDRRARSYRSAPAHRTGAG